MNLTELQEFFAYNPDTGEITWAKPPSKYHKHLVGKIATHKMSIGYLYVEFRGKRLLAHRVAFAIHNNRLPRVLVDHKNGERDDNRASNLRSATSSQNLQNQKMRSCNTSGYKGVSWHSQINRWRARITVDKKQRYLGTFASKEEAYAAYCCAADTNFNDFARIK